MAGGGIERTVARVTGRIRLRRAVAAFARLAVLALAFFLVAVLVAKLGGLSRSGLGIALAGAGALPFLGAAVAALRRVPRELAAKLVDLKFGLHDRTVSAVEFAREKDRTEFMEAHLRDAESRVRGLRPAEAAPLRLPRDLAPGLALAACVVGLAFVGFPTPRAERPTPTLTPIEVHTEELEAYRAYARDLLLRAQEEQAGPLHEAAEAVNRLVEDLADRRLDREEAFRRLGELEDRFLRGDQASAEELERALRAIGDELRRSDLTREIGEKLQEPDLDAAREEVQKLAEALQDDRRESQKALERAREAFERAAREAPEDLRERIDDLRRQIEEEQQSLLQKKQQKKEGLDEAEQRLLKQRRRELERLERQQEMNENLRRQLERLQREMQSAAERMNQSPEEASEAMQRLAEEMNRLARDREMQEQLARLLERMQDMREMLRRQQGSGSDQRQKRAGQLGRFFKLARGKGGMRIRMPGEGGEGEEQEGQEGQGGEEAQVLQLGEGNDRLLIPLPGMGMPTQGQSGMQQQESNTGIGDSHDPRMGDPTNLQSQRQTVQVQGTPNDQGASRSQVIMGAADQGFASGGYRRVYSEYRRVMEEDLDLQDIPPGVRGHLRDYMDLIRPQE